MENRYYFLQSSAIARIPNDSEMQEAVFSFQKNCYDVDAEENFRKFFRIRLLAQVIQKIIRESTITKTDFLQIFQQLKHFGKETQELMKNAMWNVFVSFFSKMAEASTSSSSSSSSVMNGDGDGLGEAWSRNFEFLFQQLGDVVPFEMNNEVPFFVCKGRCAETVFADFPFSTPVDKDGTQKYSRWIECDCSSVLTFTAREKGIDFNNIHNTHPEELLLLLGKYVSHTNKAHFSHLVSSGDLKENEQHEFKLKEAFLNIDTRKGPLDKIVIMVTAFCSLSLFDVVLKKPTSLSQIGLTLLLPFLQMSIYKCLSDLRNPQCDVDNMLEKATSKFKFENILSFVSFYNIFRPLHVIFRDLNNISLIDNSVLTKLRKEKLVDIACDMKNSFRIPGTRSEEDAIVREMAKKNAIAETDEEELSPKLKRRKLLAWQGQGYQRHDHTYNSYGFVDSTGKLVGLEKIKKELRSFGPQILVNTLHRCDDIWGELRNGRGNFSVAFGERHLENNFLGALAVHVFSLLPRSDEGNKRNSDENRIKLFWELNNVYGEAIERKVLTSQQLGQDESPYRNKEFQSGVLLTVLALCKSHSVTKISHIEMLLFETILKWPQLTDEILKIFESFFVKLLFSVVNAIREIIKDENTLCQVLSYIRNGEGGLGCSYGYGYGNNNFNSNSVGKSLQNKIRRSSENLEKHFKLDEFITICKEVLASDEDFGVITKHTPMVNFFLESFAKDIKNSTFI